MPEMKMGASVSGLPMWVKILIGVLLLGNLWFGIGNMMSNKRYAKEKKQLIAAYELKLSENIEEQLQLVTKTFVWSIRSEMIRDNYDQVGLYFNQLVKEDDRVTEIIAVDRKGKMVVSTNKRYEGKAFKSIHNETALKGDEVSITQEGQIFTIIAPIMALNSRIGTLFMLYEPDEEMLKVVDEKDKIAQQDSISTDTMTDVNVQ